MYVVKESAGRKDGNKPARKKESKEAREQDKNLSVFWFLIAMASNLLAMAFYLEKGSPGTGGRERAECQRRKADQKRHAAGSQHEEEHEVSQVRSTNQARQTIASLELVLLGIPSGVRTRPGKATCQLVRIHINTRPPVVGSGTNTFLKRMVDDFCNPSLLWKAGSMKPAKNTRSCALSVERTNPSTTDMRRQQGATAQRNCLTQQSARHNHSKSSQREWPRQENEKRPVNRNVALSIEPETQDHIHPRKAHFNMFLMVISLRPPKGTV